MELSEDNMRTLSEYLQKTLSPDPGLRRPAEKFLESVEGNRNYSMLLLHLINKAEVDPTIRIAGAVTFKNFIKRNWQVDEETGMDKIDAGDRENIKTMIVDVMLVAPPGIQKQLSDAVSIIGRSDFPNKWPGLLSHMVEKFNTGDFHIINGILHTAHSIFKRYRYEFKSQELWAEIKFVLDSFAKPLTDLAVATHNLTTVHANNAEALRVIYSSMLLICKIFYSLNYQDLPEFFEDNMSTWMPLFRSLISAEAKCISDSSTDDPGVMEELRSQVCFNLRLYALKYSEELHPFLPDLVREIWNLLLTTGPEHKYDLLVSNALQFLSTVASRTEYRSLFEEPGVLTSICEKVVIPNIQFRESDQELFEDNPEDYMRRDIEGSDVETRRRSACDLVRTLSLHFEAQITSIFSSYVLALLQEYDGNKWNPKDTAIYLVTSMAQRGATQRHGVTQTNSLVPLNDFAREHILPELARPIGEVPVLKADAIKYILNFRSVLPKEIVVGTLPDLVKHLRVEAMVVHSYAATTIDRILMLRNENNDLLVKADALSPIAQELLNGLFHCLTLKGSEENEYVMKAIMRCFSTLQDAVIPYLAELLPKLTEKLAIVARNPSKPNFNHYLFETITLSIRIVCKGNPGAVGNFETALFPIFQAILQQDVQEFLPYVLQVLSLLLGLHVSIPDSYLALYGCLLQPVLWDRPGNVKPLVALLRSFIRKATPEHIQSTMKVTGLLGVFQKLISSKANDHEGFYLIQTMMEFLPRNELEPFFHQILMLLFQRLHSSKTTKYVKGLLVFLLFFVVLYGPDELIRLVDGIQPSMFGNIVEKLMMGNLQKVSGTVERKMAAVGVTRLLTDSPALLDGAYSSLWPTLLKLLIALFELPEDEETLPDDHYVDVEDTPGYEVAYAQLAFGDRSVHDPLAKISSPKQHLAQALATLSQSRPGCIAASISQFLSPEEQAHLKTYFETAGVTLV